MYFYHFNESSVSIDTVVLDRENDVPTLQQMSELTGGIYSRVREPPMLLQTLLTYHLADDSARALLANIPQKIVDGRAICFNTKQTVDIGEFHNSETHVIFEGNSTSVHQRPSFFSDFA